MAEQYQYGGLHQANQMVPHPQFAQYPGTSDQNAQFLQSYALAQGNPSAPVFAGQSFNQNPYQHGPGPMTVPQMGAHLSSPGVGTSIAYGDYPQFNPYGQNSGVGITAPMTDVQSFGQLIQNPMNPPAIRNIYDSITQDQSLSGMNVASFAQGVIPNAGQDFGSFQGKKSLHTPRSVMNNFENGIRSSNLPSVTNPDGLRDDTVFVSKLPQSIDHEIMKSQFGTIGKIKTNAKTGMPMIWIFKERGIPKGDALVTFEDPACVQKAIKWFSENDFNGKKIEVKQAKNSQRPVIIPSGGGNNQHSNSSAGNSNRSNLFNQSSGSLGNSSFGANSRPGDMYMDQFGQQGNVSMPLRGGGGVNMRPQMHTMGIPRFGNNQNVMSGSSGFPSPGCWNCNACGQVNFGGRDHCKPCGAPRQDNGMMAAMPAPSQRAPMFQSPPQQQMQQQQQLSAGLGGPMVPNNGGAMMTPVVGPGSGLMGMGSHNQQRGVALMPPPPGVRAPPMINNGGVRSGGPPLMRGGGRGGGPMRGSSINAGRSMRPTPY